MQKKIIAVPAIFLFLFFVGINPVHASCSIDSGTYYVDYYDVIATNITTSGLVFPLNGTSGFCGDVIWLPNATASEELRVGYNTSGDPCDGTAVIFNNTNVTVNYINESDRTGGKNPMSVFPSDVILAMLCDNDTGTHIVSFDADEKEGATINDVTVGTGSGLFGNACYFDGTADYLTFADNDEWDVGDSVIISAWINTTRSAANEMVIERGGYNDGEWGLQHNDDGTNGAMMLRGTTGTTVHAFGYPKHHAKSDGIYHIFCQYNGTYGQCWTNGASNDSVMVNGSLGPDAENLTVGGRSSAYPWLGYIDSLVVTDDADGDEAMAIDEYNNRLSGARGLAGNEIDVSGAGGSDSYDINITLNFPSDTSTNGSTEIYFGYTPIVDSAINNCTLWGNFSGSWGENASNSTTVTNNSVNKIALNLSDGWYSWNMRCYNTTDDYNESIANYTVKVDTAGVDSYTLNVTLDFPTDASTNTSNQVIFGYTPVVDSAVKNCSLWGNFSGSWGLNASNGSAVTNATSNTFTLTLANGWYSWNVRCYNTTDDYNESITNRTVKVNYVVSDCWTVGSGCYTHRIPIVSNATTPIVITVNGTSGVCGDIIHTQNATSGETIYFYYNTTMCSGDMAVGNETDEKCWINESNSSGGNCPTEVFDSDVVLALLFGETGSIQTSYDADQKWGSFKGTGKVHSTGEYGSSALFDGNSDCFTLPDHDDYDLHNNLTIEYWMYSNDSAVANSNPVERTSYGAGDYGTQWTGGVDGSYQYQSFILYSATHDMGYALYQSTHSAWHHVMFVYNGTYSTVFTDGVQNISVLTNGSVGTAATNFSIGARTCSTAWYQGWIDNLIIYNYSHSPTEATNLYNNRLPAARGFGTAESYSNDIVLSVSSPTNTTYSDPAVWINFTTNVNGNGTYSWNGGSNVSVGNETTTFSSSETSNTGSNNVYICATNSTNSSDIDCSLVYFTYTPPTEYISVTINSPVNQSYFQNDGVYHKTQINVNATSNQTANFSISHNGTSYVSICNDTTSCNHTLTVVDGYGQNVTVMAVKSDDSTINTTDTKYFGVDNSTGYIKRYVLWSDPHYCQDGQCADEGTCKRRSKSETISNQTVDMINEYLNTSYVFIMGDVISNIVSDAQSTTNMYMAKATFDDLDVSYKVILGNHDFNISSGPAWSTQLFSDVFGYMTYSMVNGDFQFIGIHHNETDNDATDSLDAYISDGYKQYIASQIDSNPGKYRIVMNHIPWYQVAPGNTTGVLSSGNDAMTVNMTGYENMILNVFGHRHANSVRKNESTYMVEVPSTVNYPMAVKIVDIINSTHMRLWTENLPNETLRQWSYAGCDTTNTYFADSHEADGIDDIDVIIKYAGDVSGPDVTLNSPGDDTWSTNSTQIFNCTASDDTNLTNVVLWGNWSGAWAANGTNSSGTNNTWYSFTVELGSHGDGNYGWTCRAYDNSSNNAISASNYTIKIDTTSPSMTLIHPKNITYHSDNSTIDVALVCSDNPDSYWYELNSNGTNVSFTPNSTFTMPSYGSNNITVWCNDTNGRETSSSRYFTYSNYSLYFTQDELILNLSSVAGPTYRIGKLNDSSTSKNITFTSSGWDEEYMVIPKESNITVAQITLTPYIYEYEDDTEDAYSCTGSFFDACANAVDENSVTYSSCDTSGECYIYENITLTAVPNNVTWYNTIYVADTADCTGQNVTACKNQSSGSWINFTSLDLCVSTIQPFNEYVPGDCWDSGGTMEIRTYLMTNGDWTEFIGYSEGKANFTYYPNNITVDSGTDGTDDYSNTTEFSSGEIIDANVTAVQNYLDSCTADADGNCIFPLNFSSVSPGILGITPVINFTQKNISAIIKVDSSSSDRRILWVNSSYLIAGNLTIHKIYLVNQDSSTAYWDWVSLPFYNDSSNLTYINITDVSLNYTGIGLVPNHTYIDSEMYLINFSLTRDNGNAYDSFVVESDDTTSHTYRLNNSGTTNLTSCMVVFENRVAGSANLSSYASFNLSTFNITANSSIYMRMTLSSIPASGSIYYEKLNVSCSGTYDSISVDVFSSAPGTAPEGGTDTTSNPPQACGSYNIYPTVDSSGIGPVGRDLKFYFNVYNFNTSQTYTGSFDSNLAEYCMVSKVPDQPIPINGFGQFEITCTVQNETYSGNFIVNTNTGCQDSRKITVAPVVGFIADFSEFLGDIITGNLVDAADVGTNVGGVEISVAGIIIIIIFVIIVIIILFYTD